MAIVVPLKRLTAISNETIAQIIEEAPVVTALREAVDHVIRDLHGLPEIVGCELSQLEIYLGRTAVNPARLRQRWRAAWDRFEGWRSTHAIVSLRARTAHVKKERWEEVAQRVIDTLKRRGAFCCANVDIGQNGRWPRSRMTIIYLVARKRRGRPRYSLPRDKKNEAVVTLLLDQKLPDAEMVKRVAERIWNPDDMTDHAMLTEWQKA